MSVSRRTSTSRPVSAIFVGKFDPSKDPDEPLTRSRSSLLPSPPHTNSNSSGSGSTGRSNARSLFPGTRPAMVHQAAEERLTSHASYQDNQHGDNDDDDYDKRSTRRINDDYDEDHTAKLSDDRRSAGNSSTGTPSVTSGSSTGALSRAKSLADRNRAVLDKLASITSGSLRTMSRSPALASRTLSARENSPLTASSHSSGDAKSQPRSAASSRLSFPQSRENVDQPRLQRTPASGSDTEREPRSSDDRDFSVTPPAHPRDDGPRISLIDTGGNIRRRSPTSASPETLTNLLPIRQLSENSTSTFRGTLHEDTASSTFGATKYKAKPAKRAPLPQEFRDGMTSSEEPGSATTSNSGSISPVIPTNGRNNPFSSSASSTMTSEPSSSSRREPSPQPSLTHSSSSRFLGSKRSSTVRVPGAGARARLSHARWVSEADGSGSNTERPPRQNSYRYERRGGSAESAVAGRPANHLSHQDSSISGRRTLFGEEMRAAGLSPRKERSQGQTLPGDSPSPTDMRFPSRDAKSARMSLPSGFRPPSSSGYGTIHDQPYQSRTRDGIGTAEQPLNIFQRSPARTFSTASRSRPTSSSGPDRFKQNVRASLGLTSRPSTAAGMYPHRERDRDQDGDDRIAPHTQWNMGPQQQMQHAGRRASPLDAGERDHRRSDTPNFRPVSAAYHRQLTSSPSNALNGDHPDILMGALDLLETNLSRMPSTSGAATPHTHDCARAAEVLAEQVRTLNMRLRAATSSALEEHIEADLASAGNDEFAHDAGIWRGVGAEFRENLRTSDELVRSLTTFFLSFGKLLKDSGSSGALTPGRREGGPSPYLPHRRPESANDYDNSPSLPPRAQSRSGYDSGAYVRRTIDVPSRAAPSSNNAVDEWGQRLNAVHVERPANSDGGRRSLDDGASARRSLDRPRDLDGVDPYVRSSTSMSHVHNRRGRASPLSPTSPLGPRAEPRRPGVFSALSSRRFFSSSTAKGSNEKNKPVELVPAPRSSRTDDKSFESDDQAYESPTPAERNQSFRLRRSLPFNSERPTLQRPPLPTILPESRTSLRKDRRNKTSTTSNATVRGSSIQLSNGGLQPTTQLTTTPIITNGLTERELNQHDFDLPPSLSRSAGAAILAAVNERGDGFSRKRTISAVSGSSAMLESSPPSAVSPTTYNSFAAFQGDSIRGDRSSESSRGRRGTIGGLFR